MKQLRIALTITVAFAGYISYAKGIHEFADSIRRAYHIPELGYAVVSADSVYTMKVMGVRKINTALAARPIDRFRIGSNTKAVTGFIAALLVKEGKLSWNTRFFDLFPEMKAGSRREYHHLTLLDLLTFRAKLFMYTYTYTEPAKTQFHGSESEQRYQFAQWFFKHEPVRTNDSINFSNLGYVAAGLMLEKASGMSYRQLVGALNDKLGVQFHFGRPNANDKLQTWGHTASLAPETNSGDDYKLSWLQAAGNLNCTLGDYVTFIQLQLSGLNGRSALLTQKEFDFLHFGRTGFSIGWLPRVDGVYGPYTFNVGNPGSYLTKVYVYKNLDRAFVLFSNAQTDESDRGLDVLFEELRRRYSGR